MACHGYLYSDVELAMIDLEVFALGAGHCYGLVLGAVLVEHKKGTVGKPPSVHYIVLEQFTESFYQPVDKQKFARRGKDQETR